MYLKKVALKNIRCIEDLEMEFSSYSGWHVLLGDNGLGKSSILKAVSLALIGTPNIHQLGQNWNGWIKRGASSGQIKIDVLGNENDDFLKGGKPVSSQQKVTANLGFKQERFDKKNTKSHTAVNYKSEPKDILEIDLVGWFSAAYGPYRRFKSNGQITEESSGNSNKISAHLTLFNSDIALNRSIDWLRDLDYRVSKSKAVESDAKLTLENIIQFINKSELLPKDASIKEVNPDGVFINDVNGVTLSLMEMSDGYRSILSLLLDLIRQMSINSGGDAIFQKEDSGQIVIQLSGVVMIDEIDVHFHPKWQARIGKWFTQFFPNVQFIVTTHSPIICQSAEGGSIWQIELKDGGSKARRIEGQDFKRLVYGNILEAMGTEVFGEDTAQSAAGHDLLEKLAALNTKSMMGELDEAEKIELQRLKGVLPTESYSIN